MSDLDPSTLTPDGRKVYDAIDRAICMYNSRLISGNLPTDDCHAIAWAATGAVDKALRSIIDRIRARDVVETLGEELFDAAHEHCDDEGCAGGGLPWYMKAAERLAGVSVLGEVAVELQMRDDRGEAPAGQFPDEARADFIKDAADAVAQVEAIDRRIEARYEGLIAGSRGAE